MSETGATNVTSSEDKAAPIDFRVQNDAQSLSTENIQESPPLLSASDEKNKADTLIKSTEPAKQHPAPTTASPTPAPGPALPSEASKGAAPRKQPTSAAMNSDSCGLPPPDFEGEVETNNELPSLETLRKIESYTVLDADGRSHTFKSLYTGRNVARRVMIIFVRHFFCGNCQEYLRKLSASITPEALLQLPVSTFIAVVGCSGHELIPSYARETNCPFPIYTDPTGQLYAELGMASTLKLGSKPAYMRDKSFMGSVVGSVAQGLKHLDLVPKMGNSRQVGGEFLFEPVTGSLEPPIATPVVDVDGVGGQGQQQITQHRDDAPARRGGGNEDEDESKVEPKRITWCHRMRTTRDHAEIPELMEVLGLEAAEDGTAAAIPIVVSKRDGKKQRRWSTALQARKGTGSSMASQMSRMSLEASAAASIGGGRSASPNSGRSSIIQQQSREDIVKIRSISPSNGVSATAATGAATNGGNAVV